MELALATIFFSLIILALFLLITAAPFDRAFQVGRDHVRSPKVWVSLCFWLHASYLHLRSSTWKESTLRELRSVVLRLLVL
jgi:hypothetical protein